MKEPDYKTYHFTARQWILYGLLYFGGLFGVGYFFFRSFYFAFCMLPLGIVLLKNKQQTLHKNRQKDIRNQFSDVLQFLSVSLGVGSSFEKAFLEVISELELLYGTRQTLIIRELELLVTKMAMNQRIEEGLQSLADRTGCEEIQSFQNAVALCRSSGGNIVEIVRNTHQTILQKNEIEDDIAVICSQQKMSFRILLCMPFSVMLLMQSVSPDYMNALFTPMGRIIMSMVLLVILLAYCLGNYILREEVPELKSYKAWFPINGAQSKVVIWITSLLRRYPPERKFSFLFTELFEEEGMMRYRQHRSGQMVMSLFVFITCLLLFLWVRKVEMLFLWTGVQAAVWVLPDKGIENRARKKRSLIEEALPSFLSKLAILTDSGFTAKAAIEKIIMQMSENQLKKQLVLLQQDFLEGKSDAVCFERFATRCRTRGTSSLATLLLQNIRKGGKELSSLLRLHARAGWEKRKAEVKMKGEEKAAKLMLPTLLVFLCLMVLMATPAIMNMGLF